MSECATEKEEVCEIWREKKDDYYSPSVEVVGNKAIRIHSGGRVSTRTPEQWVNMCFEGYDENKYIDAVWEAIDWYFGPSDRRLVREKWREIVFKRGGQQQ